jgi:hypothetical protein
VFVILIPVALLVIVGVIALIGMVIGRSGGSRALMIGLVAGLVLVLGVGGAIFVLRQQQTRLLVSVPPGTAYVGRVTVDDVEHQVAGNESRALTYSGKHVVFTIILVDPPRDLTVEYAGRFLGTHYGAQGEIMRDSPWSAGVVLGALDEDDWNRVAAELIPGRGADALSPTADEESSTSN